MKKKRYFPFGYRMTDGAIEIVPEESALVQNIFYSYLAGASLQQLAKSAEQTGLQYRQNANGWNKNMISRILDDERYWNGNGFPPVINTDLAAQIEKLKACKASPKSSIRFFQKAIFCPQCNSRLIRNSRSLPRIFWECKKCNIQIGPITDNELLQSITEKLLAVCRNPQMAEPDQQPTNSISIQAARLTNEINQLLDQREVDTDRLIPLILECAAEKYKTCGIKESDHLTIRIKALFQEHSNDEGLDREFFAQTVKQVILQPDSTIQLQLLNGKTV